MELLGVEGEFHHFSRRFELIIFPFPNRNGYVKTEENDPKKRRVNLSEIITFITRSRNLGELSEVPVLS